MIGYRLGFKGQLSASRLWANHMHSGNNTQALKRPRAVCWGLPPSASTNTYSSPAGSISNWSSTHKRSTHFIWEWKKIGHKSPPECLGTFLRNVRWQQYISSCWMRFKRIRIYCRITLTQRENLSLTVIQTNTKWIDTAFNLLRILK